MIAPHFFLVVLLLSADSFINTPLTTGPKPYFSQEIEQVGPQENEILLGSLLSQNNLAIAIPIFDADFDKKLNSAVLKVGSEEITTIDNDFDEEVDDIDDDFEAPETEYSLEGDEGFCLDTTLTTDVTPPLSN